MTGSYQPSPTPPFDAKGNSKARAIALPAPFAQIAFGLETIGKDPASGKSLPTPAITATDGRLTGQVTALVAQWNKLSFGQGSTAVTGTYNPTTGTFTLSWSSKISGGPFNGFTGYWHLAGTFAAS